MVSESSHVVHQEKLILREEKDGWLSYSYRILELNISSILKIQVGSCGGCNADMVLRC
jgi:hypothetical protein